MRVVKLTAAANRSALNREEIVNALKLSENMLISQAPIQCSRFPLMLAAATSKELLKDEGNPDKD